MASNEQEPSSNGSPPIFLFLQSAQCSHCQIFFKQHWNKVNKAITQLRPDIRIESIHYRTLDYNSYDQTKYPKGLEFWGIFFPTFVVIPGDLWDKAMKDNKVTLTIDDGAEGMNLVYRDEKLTTVRGYSYDDKGVIAWLTKILQQSKFTPAKASPTPRKSTKDTRKDNTSTSAPINTSTEKEVATFAHPIAAISTPLIVEHRPHVNSSPVKTSGQGQVYSPVNNYAKIANKVSEEVGINVCTIKLVSRPPNYQR